jgi:hypothetical protein
MQNIKYQSEFLPEVEIYVVFSEYPKYEDLSPLFNEYGYGFLVPDKNIVLIDGEQLLELGIDTLKFIEAHEISHIILGHDGPRNQEDELDADLGAYILLKNYHKSTDTLLNNFFERHGIEFDESLLDRVSEYFQ